MLGVVVFLGLVLVVAAVAVARVPLERLAFFTVGLLVLTVTWNGVRIGGGAFGDGFLALAALAVAVHAFVDRRPVPLPPWLALAAIIFVLAALLVAIFPPSLRIENITSLQFDQQFAVIGASPTALLQNRSNVSALVLFEVGLVIVPILMAVVGTTPERINRLLDLFAISAALNAFVGLADRAGFHSLAPVPINGHRSAGLTVHPNYLALTCVFGVPLALRWVGRSPRATVAGLGVTLLLIGGEYSTGSRDGAVTFAVMLVLATLLLPGMKRAIPYLLPVLLILAVVVLAFTNAGSSIIAQLRLGSPTVSTTGSNYERQIAFNVALRQISSAPVQGIGFAVDNDAQNIYLQILAAAGIVGMAGFLILIGGLAAAVRRSLNGPLRVEAIALGICAFGWLLNGYFDSQLVDKYLYVLPGILIACARISRASGGAAAADLALAATDDAGLPVAVPVRV